MKLKWSTKWLLFPGLGIIAFLVAVFLVDAYVHRVEYPLGVWRMDLDDFLGNIGFLLGGIAAVWTVAKTAKRAEAKADLVAHQINGGMSDAAKAHVLEALDNSEIEVGLWRRVDALEESKQECIEREKRCENENEKMRRWVIARLDQTPLGRQNGRQSGGDHPSNG
jgi:hypothetical protein